MPSVSRGTTGSATDISGGERGKLGEGGEAVNVSGQGKHIVLMSVSRVGPTFRQLLANSLLSPLARLL